jgi:Ca2+-binding RTX toxin-like protein
VIVGGAGDDYIDGMTGNDIMVGGAGADTFQASNAGPGIDYVLDFEHGVDHIAVSGYVTYAALQAHISQQGADTVVEYSPDHFLVLQNVDMGLLTGADFGF